MRLEKIAYEKIFNSKILNRARTITKPSQICADANHLLTSIPTFGIPTLLAPIGRWIFSREWKFFMSNAQQRGLACEDFLLFRDEDMRRDPLFEHVARESLHPYMFELFRYRRQRYFKVDISVNGFEAPEYLKEEARKRTYISSLANITKFRHFYEHNYFNEMTPQTYMYRGSKIVLELFMVYGLSSRNAWTRYFFNEVHHYTTKNYIDEIRGNNKPLDFQSDDDFEEFKKKAERWNRNCPGYFAPAGEFIDFVKLREILENTRLELAVDKLTTEDFQIIAMRHKMSKHAFVQPAYEDEKVVGSNNIGKDTPRYLTENIGKGLFN